jgi:hypothetical protein
VAQRSKQGEQHLKALAGRLRVQGATMADVEIDGIAGFPTTRGA